MGLLSSWLRETKSTSDAPLFPTRPGERLSRRPSRADGLASKTLRLTITFAKPRRDS